MALVFSSSVGIALSVKGAWGKQRESRVETAQNRDVTEIIIWLIKHVLNRIERIYIHAMQALMWLCTYAGNSACTWRNKVFKSARRFWSPFVQRDPPKSLWKMYIIESLYLDFKYFCKKINIVYFHYPTSFFKVPSCVLYAYIDKYTWV